MLIVLPVSVTVNSGEVLASGVLISIGRATPLVEVPVSWTLDDYPHFEFVRTSTSVLQGLMNARGVVQNWIDDFMYLRDNLEWGIITYTFHPFVIGRGHRMIVLEELIRTLLDHGAAFMRVEDAVGEYDRRSPFSV